MKESMDRQRLFKVYDWRRRQRVYILEDEKNSFHHQQETINAPMSQGQLSDQ